MSTMTVPDSIVLTPDGKKAYVSFTGTVQVPGSALAVIDLVEAQNCARAGNEVIGYVTGFAPTSRPQAMALSPDATKIAVALRSDNEIVSRHLRIGTGPMSYDKTREPLCALLASPGPAPIKYYQPMQSNVDVPSAAGAWCGCSTSLVLTDKGITRVTLKNGKTFDSNLGVAEASIARNGWAQTTVRLPPGTTQGDIAKVSFVGAGASHVDRVGSVLLLDRGYKPIDLPRSVVKA